MTNGKIRYYFKEAKEGPASKGDTNYEWEEYNVE